jgi:hypothetical protein
MTVGAMFNALINAFSLFDDIREYEPPDLTEFIELDPDIVVEYEEHVPVEYVYGMYCSINKLFAVT